MLFPQGLFAQSSPGMFSLHTKSEPIPCLLPNPRPTRWLRTKVPLGTQTRYYSTWTARKKENPLSCYTKGGF